MGIVRFALRWPYTFYVLALLIVFLCCRIDTKVRLMFANKPAHPGVTATACGGLQGHAPTSA